MEYSGDYGRFSATLKLRPGRLVLSVFFPHDEQFVSSRKYTHCVPREGMRSSSWLMGSGDCHLNTPWLARE